jgi:hypothetical protein
MATASTGFGIALILLGVIGYVATGMQSITALIPAIFGVLLTILGMVGREPSRRKMAMHIAAAVGILGFAGSARGLAKIGAVLAGDPVERPAAVITQSIMAVMMLAFVYLCIRSFIVARRKLP